MDEIKRMLIDGEWVLSDSGLYKDIINPADQSKIATVTRGTKEDVQKAVKAAKRAYYDDGWCDVTITQRSQLLNQFADEMERNVVELATLETLNTGKAYLESEYDVYDSAACVRYYADLINKPMEQTYTVADPNIKTMLVREPIGVVGMISAWNFPISLAIWKIAPALAAGNAIVFKPAEITPLSAILLFELLQKVGFPRGVINLVLGSGSVVGNEIAENPEIDKVAFTGGIQAGRAIMRAAAGNMKGISLELGGKSPCIMFADADFATAVDYALYGMFYNQGEVCSASSRILV